MASLQTPLGVPSSPKSHFTRSGSRNLHCWSKLPQDLLIMVFERLGFADFQRAKSVCSSWQSASIHPKPNNQIPWMILSPTDKNYCLLFNPEEKDKFYKTQDLGDDFAKSFCVATYKSWLLMEPRYDEDIQDYQCNLYILDLLTRERINLPTLNSKTTPSVLWINEKTKDYLVITMINNENAVFSKKGDISWKQIPQLKHIEECFHMVYNDHKLYCLNTNKLKIFDFSSEIPRRIFKISVHDCISRTGRFCIRYIRCCPIRYYWTRVQYNVVVTVGGDVLLVCGFKIYKMDSSKENIWEEIDSLGDEAILLDLGITVLAKDLKGIKKNSIYFNVRDFEDKNEETDAFIFNLDTKMVEQQPHQFIHSSIPCSSARWFLPSFKRE